VYLVTGGAGFIGNAFIEYLNSNDINNIVVIDTLVDEYKWKRVSNQNIVDFIDYSLGEQEVEKKLASYSFKAVFHIGADSNVLNDDSLGMMKSNFEFTKVYFAEAIRCHCPFIFASSSAIYGNTGVFNPESLKSDPHNVYAFSKLMSDKYLCGLSDLVPQMNSFRFFNVFGDGESVKNKNASLPSRFSGFLIDDGGIDLFDVDIQRDYVWVDDLCKVLYDALVEGLESGVYNLGSGEPISHSEVAEMAAKCYVAQNPELTESKLINKISMPDNLAQKFQYYTKAEKLSLFVADRCKGTKIKMERYISSIFEAAN